MTYWRRLGAPFRAGLYSLRSPRPGRSRIREAGSRPSGDDPIALGMVPHAGGRRSRARRWRRYARAPAAALFTGLGVGEWARYRAPRRSLMRPVFVFGDNRRGVERSRVIIALMTDDMSRPVATRPDSDFTLTIDEALERYGRAGLPRTPRSVQRYCAKGHLECRLIETQFGEKYLISPESVDKHIAYIEEVRQARQVPTCRGMPRPVATLSRQVAPGITEEKSHGEPRQGATTSPDLSRPVATELVEQLEKRLGEKDGGFNFSEPRWPSRTTRSKT